jgi:membrane protein involved in colicin uptake
MTTIRTFNTFLTLTVLSLVIASCGGKKHEEDHEHHHGAEASSEAGDWKEMDSFHLIMAETFHPYKDSANLQPAKIHAEHLAMEADKWASSTLPEKVNNDETKARLEKLKADSRALVDKIKAGAPDAEVGAQLTSVHDLFHEIQESWYGGSGEHHH